MKFFVLLIIFLLFSKISVKAQQDSTPLPPYLKTKQVPGFKVLLLDSSTYFYKYQLKKKTPTLIVFFNPDCDHCQAEARNISDSIKFLQKMQILFVSSAPFGEIKKFAFDYNLDKHHNIKVGRDEKYFLSAFYKLRYSPFVAVYDENGDLVRAFEGGTTILKLAQLF